MSDTQRMPGVPEALQDPVLKRYPLRRQRIPIGARMLSVVLPDDRAWLREGSWAPAVVRGHEPPYWIRVWPAAVAMARQLARAGDLCGVRVLDLGCGVGIPGIQAAALGAAVCFADREPDALQFARWNAQSQPGCGIPPTVQHVDWAQGAVDDTFDLVLLSDVTYHQNHHAPVRRQLAKAVAVGGAVLHGDPMRELSSAFLENLAAADHCLHVWNRMTTFREHRLDVRLAVASRTEAGRRAACARLAVDLAGSIEA